MTEDPGTLFIGKLVADWLTKEFPDHVINTNHSGPADLVTTVHEIMVDGVGVGEIFESEHPGKYRLSMYLIHPRLDECTIISLANPESLPMLSEHVRKYIDHERWGDIMKANRTLTGMLITHRSSVGYNLKFI